MTPTERAAFAWPAEDISDRPLCSPELSAQGARLSTVATSTGGRMTLPATLDQPAPASAVQPEVLPDEFDVWVDEEDILLGARQTSTQCAIARAIRRTLRIADVHVQPFSGAHIDGYHYDHDAYDFIIAFDCGLPVEPRAVHFTAVR